MIHLLQPTKAGSRTFEDLKVLLRPNELAVLWRDFLFSPTELLGAPSPAPAGFRVAPVAPGPGWSSRLVPGPPVTCLLRLLRLTRDLTTYECNHPA